MNSTKRKKHFQVPTAILLSLVLALGTAVQPAAAWTSKTLCGPSSNEWMDQEWVCRHTFTVRADVRIQLDIQVVKSETSRLIKRETRPVALQVSKRDKNGVVTVLGTAQRNQGGWWVAPSYVFSKGDHLIISGTMLGDLYRNNDIILYVEKTQTVLIRR